MITDKKAACAAVGGFLKGDRRQSLTQLECAVECCTGDDCNKDIIPVLQTGTCNWNFLKRVYGNIEINWKTINK